MSNAIDFTCPKCASGRATTSIRYNSVMNQLECRCTICGYEWNKTPADTVTTSSTPEDTPGSEH